MLLQERHTLLRSKSSDCVKYQNKNKFHEVAFLPKAFSAYDAFLSSIKSIDTNHPLASMLYESTLAVREILSCWHIKRLHETAITTVENRSKRILSSLQKFKNKLHAHFFGDFEIKSTKGKWIKLDLVHTRYNSLYYLNTETNSLNTVDLKNVASIKQENEQEFVVFFKKKNPSKKLHFRASIPSTSHELQLLFESFVTKNNTTDLLSQLPETKKISLYQKHVFQTKKAAFKELTMDKSSQFILTTNRDLEGIDLNRQKKFESLYSKLTSDGRRGVMEVFQVSAKSYRTTEQAHIVKITKSYMQKYTITISLPSTHRRNHIKQPSITICATNKNATNQTYFFRNFLYYKLRSSSLQIEMCFNEPNKENIFLRNFIFKDQKSWNRCLDLVTIFTHAQEPNNQESKYAEITLFHPELVARIYELTKFSKTKKEHRRSSSLDTEMLDQLHTDDIKMKMSTPKFRASEPLPNRYTLNRKFSNIVTESALKKASEGLKKMRQPSKILTSSKSLNSMMIKTGMVKEVDKNYDSDSDSDDISDSDEDSSEDEQVDSGAMAATIYEDMFGIDVLENRGYPMLQQ